MRGERVSSEDVFITHAKKARSQALIPLPTLFLKSVREKLREGERQTDRGVGGDVYSTPAYLRDLTNSPMLGGSNQNSPGVGRFYNLKNCPSLALILILPCLHHLPNVVEGDDLYKVMPLAEVVTLNQYECL